MTNPLPIRPDNLKFLVVRWIQAAVGWRGARRPDDPTIVAAGTGGYVSRPLSRRRPMRRSLPTLLALLALTAPLAGQAKPGHVYRVFYYDVLPGKGQAYNKLLADVAIPVLDELVRRKVIVSHLILTQSTGAGEYNLIGILELPNWAALDGFDAKLDGATQAVLHKSWSEATASSFELRRFLRSETYTAAGQQP